MKFSRLTSFKEKLFFLLLVSLFGVFYYFSFFYLDSFNSKAIHHLKKGEKEQALNLFKKALSQKPYDPFSHINLSLSYDLLDRESEARKHYKIVKKNLFFISKRALFVSYFNEGSLLGRKRKLDEALQNYQKALEFNKDTLKIKTNIELLFTKKNPSKKPTPSQDSKEDEKPFEREDEGAQGKKGEKEKSEGSGEGETGEPSENTDEKKGGEGGQGESDERDQEKENEKKGEEEDKKKDKEQDSEQGGEGEGSGQESGDEKTPEPVPQGETKVSGKDKQESLEEKVIEKEIEQQESEAIKRFFKGKQIFGDKDLEDW